MGSIDRQGNYVINPQFDYVYSFSEGLAAVYIDGKGGFIDLQGNYVINPQFDYVRSFLEGLAAVRIRIGDWGSLTGKATTSLTHNSTTQGVFGRIGGCTDRRQVGIH